MSTYTRSGHTLGNVNRFDDTKGLPLTYFRRWGFSINEGAGPVNVHAQWNRDWCYLFFYLYVLGARFSFVWRKARK